MLNKNCKRDKRKLDLLKKAEIVELIEAMKHYLTPEERKKVFGADGVASRLTDPETKRNIAKIKIKNGFKKKDAVMSDIKPSVGTSDS